MPLLLLYTTADDYIEEELSKDLAEILDFAPDDISIYSFTNQLIQPGLSFSDKKASKCVVIEGGNHFPMKTHPEIVGNAVLELLKYVNNRSFLDSAAVIRSKET